MALHSLITSSSHAITSGSCRSVASPREVKPELLPEMSWDFEWGTNMQPRAAARRGKQLTARPAPKQIIMVTDGEPTAHIKGAPRCGRWARRR